MQMGINFAMKPSLKRRGIDIAALFAGIPGRVGCYYGTKAGPSYSDILARNREALGAEEVPVSAYQSSTNWQLSGGVSIAGGRVVATAAAQYSTGNYYRNLPGGQVYVVTLIVDSVTVGSVRPVFLGGTQVTGTSRTAPGTYVDLMVATEGTNRIGIQFATAGTNTASARVFVQPISDWSKLVLFDDANGTVPVFSVFQSSRGRGLLLDASQGLVRGPELCQDVGFDNASLWTLIQPTSGSVTVGGGAATITSGDGSYAAVSPTALNQIPVVGKWYEVSYTVSSATGGGIRVDMAGVSGPVRSGPGAYSHKLQAIGTQTVAVVRGGGVSGGVVTDLSVRELPGNHMVQPTAAARGELSARYNLLTGTDTLSGWTGSNGSVTPNAVLAPDGSMTGAYLAFSGAGYLLSPSASIGAAISGNLGLYVKSMGASLTTVRIQKSDGSERVAINVNFSTGAYNSSGGAASTTDLVDFSPVGGGWYKLTVRGSLATSTSATIFISASAAGQDLAVWRPDFRLTADAIPSIPSYQRVTSATDYDDVGFPVYWRGQTDDWAYTDINPGGATKAVILWSGQKMSDAATAALIELSALSSTTPNTLGVFYPVTPNASNANVRSGGSIPALSANSTECPAGGRDYLRLMTDIANDKSQIYVDGVFKSENTSDQGTGAYASNRLYFGSRGGTVYYANIREFAPPLVLFQPTADAGLSASQIAALDKAYAKAAGVTL